MNGFLFGGDTGETAQSLARRRAVAEAMLAGSTAIAPRNTGEGLHALGQALSGRFALNRINKQEEEGRASAREAFAPIAEALMGRPSSADTTPPPFETASLESGLPASLIQSESGGNFAASNNVPGSGGTGHFGRGQFSHGRLQDAMSAGVIPQGTTPQAFMDDPQMQQAVEQWHVGDINNYIDQNNLGRFEGQSINGTPVTREGMLNVAHLGGSGGLQRFLETNGAYNPSDANGTSLSDYLTMGAGGGAQVQPQGPQLAQAGSDLSLQQIMQAAENPFLTDGERSVLDALMQQRMQASDPMRQLQMQSAQVGLERDRLELEQARNPQPEPVDPFTLSEGQVRFDGQGNVIAEGPRGNPEQERQIAQDAQGVRRYVETGEPVFEGDAMTSDGAISQARDSLELIAAVRNNPSLGGITGPVQGRLPGFLDQGKQDLLVRIEQLQGRAFLEAFESLKGGGQITEREGQAAQAAIARLDRTQSVQAYQAALDELSTIMRRAIARGEVSQQGNESAPEGVQANEWQYMTPQERALWQNLR